VPKPLSLRAQRLLCAGLEPLGVVGKGSKLGQTRLARCCPLLELLVPAPCRCELAPGQAQLGAATLLILAGESIEDVELVRGACEATLLELPRHRDQPFRRTG
jgi:hypothetical protein